MTEITSPVKAIRAFCLECVCGNSAEVKRCEITRCPLHPFRFGKNPFRKGRELSEEEKAKMAENMRKYRAKEDEEGEVE